jgi:hypothetical protein
MDRTLGDDGYLGPHNLGQTPSEAILLTRERRCSGQLEMATVSRQVGWKPLPALTLSHSIHRCTRQKIDPPDLEEFVMWNDRHLYDREIGRAYLTDRAQVRLFNASSSLEELHAALKNLDLSNDERLRPTWDQYFMQLASLAAQRSNCMKRRVGCVIVRDRRVISTGYNGTPRNITNCNEGGCRLFPLVFQIVSF